MNNKSVASVCNGKMGKKAVMVIINPLSGGRQAYQFSRILEKKLPMKIHYFVVGQEDFSYQLRDCLDNQKNYQAVIILGGTI